MYYLRQEYIVGAAVYGLFDTNSHSAKYFGTLLVTTACSWFEGTCEQRYSVGAIGELQQIYDQRYFLWLFEYCCIVFDLSLAQELTLAVKDA